MDTDVFTAFNEPQKKALPPMSGPQANQTVIPSRMSTLHKSPLGFLDLCKHEPSGKLT